MKWCITGGCGFIGTNLITRLVADDPGCAIRVVDSLVASTRDGLRAVTAFTEVDAAAPGPLDGPGVELVVGDIRDAALAVRATEGADAVVHLAACTGVLPSVEDPRTDCETNVLGVLNYLEACRAQGCDHFVLASSGAPLGDQDPPIHEQKVPRPISPYGASKLCGEAYCSAYHGSYGLRTVALRFGNVYGPRSANKQSVVAKFIKRALAGETLEIWGDGKQTRDFIYVEDLVGAICAATRSDAGGEVYQIATHRETTVGEITELLVGLIEERTGVRATVVHTDPYQGEIQRNFSDVSKAARMLGWTPTIELEDGLRRTLAWFLDEAQSEGPAGT